MIWISCDFISGCCFSYCFQGGALSDQSELILDQVLLDKPAQIDVEVPVVTHGFYLVELAMTVYG
jgi:hypothetical protein